MIREPRKIRLWRSIYTIWMKEIRDNVRDRKALRQSITTPLIFGLIFALFTPLGKNSVIGCLPMFSHRFLPHEQFPLGCLL